MLISIISDTHLPSIHKTPDGLGPELANFLVSTDLIIHAGDVVRPSILDWCEQFAPVICAKGNNDDFEDKRAANKIRIELEGWRFGVVHELRPEDRPMDVLIDQAFPGESMDMIDVLITGDPHVARLEYRDHVLLINSGSPTLPHHLEWRLGSAVLLDVSKSRIKAEIVSLGETRGKKNPTSVSSLVVKR
ncbi:MAG: metallophosphoesterase family protein [Chloroflexota bacterium]|nr:metallophosphoesterase family protein [Chloroflexota bacterium]